MMPLRVPITALCLIPFLASNSAAMPEAPDAATDFTRLISILPCQSAISTLAVNLGYRETSQTRMDTDYIDIEYSDAHDQSHLTVAVESTPIGAHFSVLLDIPETDKTFADTLVTALRRNWSLPKAAQLQNLASGTAQFWTVPLPNGTVQITVYYDKTTTRIFGVLVPIARGRALPC